MPFAGPASAAAALAGPMPVTHEQQSRYQLDQVVAGLGGGAISLSREREESERSSKLEQIAMIRQGLLEEGVDLGDVPMPEADAPMAGIDRALASLRLKNDSKRFADWSEEAIIGAARGLGTLLNGERAIPLTSIRPDMRGWHNTVATKLNRMRFETSTVIRDMVRGQNMGPGTRIMLELLPSMILYGMTNKGGGSGLASRYLQSGVEDAPKSASASDAAYASMQDI